MRKFLHNLFAPSSQPARKPTRRVRLATEECEPRLLMTVGVLDRIPLDNLLELTPTPPGHFASLSASDASGDDSPATVFKGGALRVNYNIALGNTIFLAPAQNQNQDQDPLPPPPPPPSPLDRVTIEAWQGAVKVAELGSFNPLTVTGGLVNLANTPSLAGGAYTIKATAYFTNGSTATTTSAMPLQIKSGTLLNGDFTGQTFTMQQLAGDGVVVHGNGGTDTLDLEIDRDLIASINGMSPSTFSPTAGGQAIYQGLAVDYVRLTNGREVYFTGIENLTVLGDPVLTQSAAFVSVVGGGPVTLKVPETIRLAVTPNDPDFDEQWNLHVTDVPDAWRFTKGSSQVLLVSLDTGVFLRQGDRGITHGIQSERLIYDNSDDDNMTPPPGGVNRGHGHQAISVMIAAAGDGKYHTGINWVSDVYVNDVYHGVNLQDAIEDSLDYARARGFNVVFQGGIQGTSWQTSGGSQAELESLISSYSSALYVIAAGNGGPGGNLVDPNFATSVSGVAKLQTNHSNVIAAGALEHTAITVNGLENANTVNLAGYSNRGSNLTMVAPTDSPATTFQSDVSGTRDFGGTSCANPNLAAMASLVWSVNPSLSGAQVRQILEKTALDLGDAGRDNTFGAGLVDTGEAVRRAVALARDPALANLAFNPSSFRAVVGAALNHVLQPLDAMPVFDVVVPPPVQVAPTPPPPVDLLARVVKQKGLSVVKVFNGGTLQQTLKPFGKNAVKLQVALIDVNGDGVKDVVVTARVNRKLRKKVYSGTTLAPVA